MIMGDGIGPEIAEATMRCVDATGAAIKWDIQQAGTDIMEKVGTPLPDETIKSLENSDAAIKAPITTPVGTGFRSINVHLRQHFDLYACLRPCKYYPGIRSKYDNIDLVIVRENTEDCYAGIEFEKDTDAASELIDWLNNHNSKKIRPDSGITIKPISVEGTERIVKFAFEYARATVVKRLPAFIKPIS